LALSYQFDPPAGFGASVREGERADIPKFPPRVIRPTRKASGQDVSALPLACDPDAKARHESVHHVETVPRLPLVCYSGDFEGRDDPIVERALYHAASPRAAPGQQTQCCSLLPPVGANLCQLRTHASNIDISVDTTYRHFTPVAGCLRGC